METEKRKRKRRMYTLSLILTFARDQCSSSDEGQDFGCWLCNQTEAKNVTISDHLPHIIPNFVKVMKKIHNSDDCLVIYFLFYVLCP